MSKAEEKGPAFPEILEEQDRVIMRFGNSEVIQTRESIMIQERCTIRPHSVPTGD